MASGGFEKQMASQKQWLDVGVHNCMAIVLASVRGRGEAAEVVTQSGLLGTQGRLWHWV